MALAWRASRSQQSSCRNASNCAARKRCLESRCPARLRRSAICAAARAVEEHHRLGRHRAALGGAEREHVDAGLPGDLGGARVQPHQRVGEARAVHVHLHAVRVRDPGERRDLVGPVDGAGFARLREREAPPAPPDAARGRHSARARRRASPARPCSRRPACRPASARRRRTPARRIRRSGYAPRRGANTAPQGGLTWASASAFAAVPVGTRNTATSRSKISPIRRSTARVRSSLP